MTSKKDSPPLPPSAWSFASSVHQPDSPSSPRVGASGMSSSHSDTARPRPSRHSSLPGALFPSRSASIFGSATTAETPSNGLARSAQTEPANNDRSQVHPALQPSALKQHQYDTEASMSVDARLIPRVERAEKDADDPTTPPASGRGARRTESTTLTTLSRLFAVQAATSPDHSRTSSYVAQARQPSSYARSIHLAETTALPEHLYSRGLLSGRHSDITVHAFGQPYRLHRLILDRSPFFASALSEPWLEANAKEMTVHPEDIDGSITQRSFDLALKRLYGCANLDEEDENPVGLFATGCWLEIQDLIECSIESMLRQMTPETLSPLIRLVTNNYYGRAGEKILASAKSMLCRDGWRMPSRHWDGIPGDIVREIVGGDGFFIDNEWDRWILAKKLLDRRLQTQAAAAGLLEPGRKRKVQKVPQAANLMAVRFDTVYRRHGSNAGRGVPQSLQKWIALYTHPDVEPLLVLLDEGIHYVHLDFERLQYIRTARDCLGLPVLPEKVISNALWQQMELRQRVMNVRETDLELGLSVQYTEDTAVSTSRDTTMPIASRSDTQRAKGKRKATSEEGQDGEDIESGSWDGNGKPRKFWIPSSDCNILMGASAEPIIATSNNTTMQRYASRMSANLQPEDVQWAADFSAATSQPRPSLENPEPGQSEPTATFSHYPPFRFAAEFPNPRLLKEKKRFYSRTVFYAGSLWNVYIQKIASSRSKQLGVYLHRAKERETEEVIAGTAVLAQGSVDERIGQLEREMVMRSERRERRQYRRTVVGSDGPEGDGAESSGSAGVEDGSLLGGNMEGGSGTSAGASTMRSILACGHHKTGQTDILSSSPPHGTDSLVSTDDSLTPDLDDDELDLETESQTSEPTSNKFHVPALPPYVDARPTIRTYFKIYSPSRGGRMLSVYESAPDKFNFSQSWGWKSSTLMLDEGLLSDDIDDGKDDVDTAIGEERHSRPMKGRGDGKLRFMVVIGNI
ncbi:hypothetical protein CBER1_04100 [Lecanosticta acicola]|uniref:BTB domain-containing protein n=1 Tax=Lecanosticta acicola TaxID=111012 RepID=A0AAI8Z6P3_9PEZI|nr:hypothetical protein CBER1_04100 [Lecanosticta acicola]